MNFRPQIIKVLEINKRAKQISAVRFDKGSPSPIIPSSIDKSLLEEFYKSIKGFLNNYPNREGFNPLIELIQEIELTTNRREVKKELICLTNGALSALFYLLASLLNKKDPVILNDLSFEGFTSVINSLGLTPVQVAFENKEELEKCVKRVKPKALILNSPENPSGKVYQKELLTFLDYISKKYNLLIISDEVNNQNIYPPYKYTPPSQYISGRHLVTINSFSKNYFLPGIRLGWIIGNNYITKRVKNIFTVSQVGIGYPSQILAYFVVRNYENQFIECRKKLLSKKQSTERVLKRNGLNFLNPVMAGSVFFIETKVNSQKLAEYLLNKYKIAVIPGVYFGKKWRKWIRLGFGEVSEEEIKKNIPIINNVILNHLSKMPF